MTGEALPHLDLPRESVRPYRRRGVPIEQPPLPRRAQGTHGRELIEQLEAVLTARPETIEAPPALGANAVLDLVPGLTADPAQLARGTAAYVDTGDHSAIVYFPTSDAKKFRQKLTQYSDPAKNGKTGSPRNNKLVAPIEQIRQPTLADLAEPWDLESALDTDAAIWIELWTPGGTLGEPHLRAAIESAVEAFVARHGGHDPVLRFEASEHDIYLAGLSGDGVRLIPGELPAVTSLREPSQARLERMAHELVGDVIDDDKIGAPPPDAFSVAVLDTGIAEDHPLLRPTLVAPGVSVVPGITSAQDGHPEGHGTGMAGTAAYHELAAQIAGGRVSARSRIANVRLWSDEPSIFWASRTEDAVAEAEAMPGQVVVHMLCLSSGSRPRQSRTSWSFAVDWLAYNDGAGRLICVAAGNVAADRDPQAYPATNQAAEIHDPAQAVNALTAGGYTELDALDPTRPGRSGLTPAARAGELSPHTTTGVSAGPIKPDLLMEAGNACPDGTLPNVGIEELSVLTTSSRHATGRILESYDGTSIATAALAGLASDVAAANRTRRPETIRALIVNSARWPARLRSQFPNRTERIRCAGYGVPNRNIALASASNRATLIHEGTMAPYSVEGKLDGMHLIGCQRPTTNSWRSARRRSRWQRRCPTSSNRTKPGSHGTRVRGSSGICRGSPNQGPTSWPASMPGTGIRPHRRTPWATGPGRSAHKLDDVAAFRAIVSSPRLLLSPRIG